MKKYPCTPNCEKRTPGCHGACKEYLDARAENDLIIEARMRERADADYHMQAAVKNKYKGIKNRMK